VRLLKAAITHLLTAAERRFTVGAIRFVRQALISTGMGWMDAEPEIARIKPDIYAVNEDGDKPEKRDFCQERGIEYVCVEAYSKGRPRPTLQLGSSRVLNSRPRNELRPHSRTRTPPADRVGACLQAISASVFSFAMPADDSSRASSLLQFP